MEGFPDRLLYTVTFAEAGDKTTVTILAATMDGVTAAEQAAFESILSSMHGGFGNAIDQLASYLDASRS